MFRHKWTFVYFDEAKLRIFMGSRKRLRKFFMVKGFFL